MRMAISSVASNSFSLIDLLLANNKCSMTSRVSGIQSYFKECWINVLGSSSLDLGTKCKILADNGVRCNMEGSCNVICVVSNIRQCCHLKKIWLRTVCAH